MKEKNQNSGPAVIGCWRGDSHLSASAGRLRADQAVHPCAPSLLLFVPVTNLVGRGFLPAYLWWRTVLAADWLPQRPFDLWPALVSRYLEMPCLADALISALPVPAATSPVHMCWSPTCVAMPLTPFDPLLLGPQHPV